jgi:O-acetyl-ADP-ribose deacetylase (regulator of RNase III)
MSRLQTKLVFDDLELSIEIRDLLSAPTDVIVNPANVGLSHGGGLAAQIVLEGGDAIQDESNALISRIGQLQSGMAVFTSAGRLPYKAIIHAVGPFMGRGEEKEKIQKAVSNCLQLCANNNWDSIALPAISTGIFQVPVEICVQGFLASITAYLTDQTETQPNKIMICLTESHYPTFARAFEQQWPDQVVFQAGPIAGQETTKARDVGDPEQKTGFVDLSKEDHSGLDDDKEIGDWFD